ncbi:hypothetical protein CBS101457_004862 [Exobasidium rhododendri]|nr:hypothetical protein CBS101457_004862 [Exobasidium rhododendri]
MAARREVRVNKVKVAVKGRKTFDDQFAAYNARLQYADPAGKGKGKAPIDDDTLTAPSTSGTKATGE